MAAEREKQQREFEKKREEVERKNRVQIKSMESKFKSTKTQDNEKDFKNQTVGMVTLEEYRKARAGLLKQSDVDSEKKTKKKKKKKKKKRKLNSMLSFAEEDEDEELNVSKDYKSGFGKDPTVETSFLPDEEREMRKQKLRQDLEREWKEKQERMKEEKLKVTYSYWDGSGHRRDIVLTKCTSIGQFLKLARKQLLKEFPELRGVPSENLMYIKEDTILPIHYSFYDFIVTKARGKSGPLFHFDVHDDVRLVNDSRIEKDESHPGKIVERRWYERNKHIFPASRWETYNPNKVNGKYTIRGGGGSGNSDSNSSSVAMAGIWSVGANL